MLIDLHSIKILLSSRDDRVVEQWQQLFSFELVDTTAWDQDSKPDLVVEAEVVSCLQSLPSWPIIYETTDPNIIVQYDQARQLQLRYSNAGHIQLWLPDKGKDSELETTSANIVLAGPSVNAGALENLTAMALAPLLRRRGLFLIHAFTAADEQGAILFVGPSGSGKTSSGLALVTAGWHFLANDLAILCQNDLPYALLSPGTIQVTPKTFDLLPQLKSLISLDARKTGSNKKVSIPRGAVISNNEPVRSAPIAAIIFPSVGSSANHQLSQVPRAVGYARLMASSMDLWDQEIWAEHLIFLEHLSQVVDFYDLALGPDLSDLAQYLPGLLSVT